MPVLPGPQLPFGDHLRLVGNAPALGNWKVDTAPRLEWSEGNVWTVTLDCVPLKPIEFKFVHMKHDGWVEALACRLQ